MFDKIKDRANSQFGLVPNKKMERSGYNFKDRNKLTFNAAKLIPINIREVIPGDIARGDVAMAVRSTTPIAPVMDNLYLDVWSFFVPNRILMADKAWEQIQGENTTGKWAVGDKGTKGSVPLITPPSGGFDRESVAAYMGFPIGRNTQPKNHLPIRAYVKIWNTYFRDQNNQVLAFDNSYANSDTTGVTAATGDPVANAYKGGEMLNVGKMYDYFTYATPSPQKAADVLIPLGDIAPVNYGRSLFTADSIAADNLAFSESQNGVSRSGTFIQSSTSDGEGMPSWSIHSPNGATYKGNHIKGVDSHGFYVDNGLKINGLQGTGVFADLSQASSVSVNRLREFIVSQQIFEGDSDHGTRYFERLESIWGIKNEMSRLDNPEYLGHFHGMLNMDQVLQTSSTDSTSPQGNTAAYSLTGIKDMKHIDYSVKEHGYIITLAAVRQTHTYSDGIHRLWSKTERFDFFEPAMGHLGADMIRNDEIWADGSDKDSEAFGYRPKWDEYRHGVSRVCGAFAPNAPQALEQWSYTDKFANRPVLGDDFIKETPLNIDRTLALSSSVADQFKMDFMLQWDMDRPIPLHSTPGLERI